MDAVISGRALDGCCLFLMGSGWLLFIPDGLYMVAVYFCWALDGIGKFVMGFGWMLLFRDGLWIVDANPDGLWMIAIIS